MLKIEKGGLCEEKLHVEVMLIERNVKMFELEKPWRFVVVAEMEIREALSSSLSLFLCLLLIDGHKRINEAVFVRGRGAPCSTTIFFLQTNP
jgi:hypothetical protein